MSPMPPLLDRRGVLVSSAAVAATSLLPAQLAAAPEDDQLLAFGHDVKLMPCAPSSTGSERCSARSLRPVLPRLFAWAVGKLNQFRVIPAWRRLRAPSRRCA